MEYFAPINVLNLGIGADHVKNLLWWAIDLPLPLSTKNVAILCGTNIPIDTPCDIADCIIRITSIFQKKSSGFSVNVCGLIPHDECWSVNRVLINEMKSWSISAILMALFLYSKIMDGISLMVPSIVLFSIKICCTSSNKAMLNWPSQYH